MYIGGYLLVIVVGALLRWAVTYEAPNFDIQTAGLIIMIVAIVGLVISTLLWFHSRGYAALWRRPTCADDHPLRDSRGRPIHEQSLRERSTDQPTAVGTPPRDRVMRDYVPPPRDQPDASPTDDSSEDETFAGTRERPAAYPPGQAKPDDD